MKLDEKVIVGLDLIYQYQNHKRPLSLESRRQLGHWRTRLVKKLIVVEEERLLE